MEKVKRRNPLSAFILSYFGLGLGQLYNGQIKKGLFFFIICLVLNSLLLLIGFKNFYGVIIFASISWLLFFWVSIDSIINAEKLKEYQLKPYNKWYIYVGGIFITLFVYSNLIYPYLFFGIYKMKGMSMSPTIQDGERIAVDHSFYRDNKTKFGDIIIFPPPDNPEKLYIRRIIAIEGDRVELKGLKILVNGKEIIQNWGFDKKDDQIWEPFIYKVPKNSVFVLGDNLDQSRDSRELGAIYVKNIKGKVLYIYWSKDLKKLAQSFNN